MVVIERAELKRTYFRGVSTGRHIARLFGTDAAFWINLQAPSTIWKSATAICTSASRPRLRRWKWRPEIL
jgi:hypothetical protein